MSMKYYNIAYVGTMDNRVSFMFDQYPLVICCNQEELKDIFNHLRVTLNHSFKAVQKKGLNSYKGYKYGVTITIIDALKDKYRTKTFYINPLNLKNK